MNAALRKELHDLIGQTVVIPDPARDQSMQNEESQHFSFQFVTIPQLMEMVFLGLIVCLDQAGQEPQPFPRLAVLDADTGQKLGVISTRSTFWVYADLFPCAPRYTFAFCD